MNGLNIGEVLWQLFNIGFLVLIVVLFVSLFRSNKNRREQLDRIEKKINDFETQIKKGYD